MKGQLNSNIMHVVYLRGKWPHINQYKISCGLWSARQIQDVFEQCIKPLSFQTICLIIPFQELEDIYTYNDPKIHKSLVSQKKIVKLFRKVRIQAVANLSIF